jgi:tetratricopeptide (TPR) repeat protein
MSKRFKKKKVASSEIPAKAADTGTVGQRFPSWLSRDWLWGLILMLAVILAYQPVWHAGFVWDDDSILTANPCIVGPLGLKEIWTTSAADVCPLTLTTLWVEHALWGLAPLPYHLVNVFMHGACAVVLWRVLRSLEVPGAWLGAALWALHPVEVESVAWITEIKNTQSGLFFLLSILFFLRWLKARDLDGRIGGDWKYGLTLLFAALAMASKSSTVILPVILCLCAWWVEGRWQWRSLVGVVPVFFMSIAASALSIWTQGLHLATDTHLQVRTWPERLVTAGDAVWFYLGKLLWPHPLITVYPRWQIDAGQWLSYLPLLAVMIVLLILWLKRESWSRPWFFAFAYFLVALLPVLGLVNLIWFWNSFVADHFQYLASMGPLALVGAGMAKFAKFIFPKKPWLEASVCAGLLLIPGMLSWQRVWAYESVETLGTDTLAKNPNSWVVHNILGAALLQKGERDEAIVELQKALEINPDFAEARNILGNALRQSGRVEKAMQQYQEALRLKPDYAEAHNNLGVVLLQSGRVSEAMNQCEQALRLKPDYAEAHYNLGNALLQAGRTAEAMEQYEQAVRLKPDYAEAHSNLGVVLQQAGRIPEAIAQYEESLKLDPDNLGAHYNLGVALEQSGRIEEAIQQYQETLRLNPDNAAARSNLAKTQAMARQSVSPK